MLAPRAGFRQTRWSSGKVSSPRGELPEVLAQGLLSAQAVGKCLDRGQMEPPPLQEAAGETCPFSVPPPFASSPGPGYRIIRFPVICVRTIAALIMVIDVVSIPPCYCSF